MAGIEQVRAIHNPQRAYMWEVEFLDLPTGDSDTMKLRASSVNIGGVSTDPIEWNFKSEKTTFAGRTASGRTVSFDFTETEGAEVYSFLRDLYDLSHDEKTGQSLERPDYSFDIRVRTFATDDTTVTQTHVFKGSFVSEIGEVSLGYDSNEAMTVNATFTYQRHDRGTTDVA